MNSNEMKSVIKEYNDIMMSLCYEHNTIGTEFSQNTENWNLRDMVAECDYVLSCYYEEGHVNCEMRHSKDKHERMIWISETKMLKEFINNYKPFIKNMKCFEGHCSKFDN